MRTTIDFPAKQIQARPNRRLRKAGDFDSEAALATEKKGKFGVHDLKGPAVEWFNELRDDNDAVTADEKRAIENFDSMRESFVRTHRRLIDSN